VVSSVRFLFSVSTWLVPLIAPAMRFISFMLTGLISSIL